MRLHFTGILIFLSFLALAQKEDEMCDHLYGKNPMLYNGVKYSFFPNAKINGHQFIENQNFTEGKVTINGKEYTSLNLNYDVYNQKLLLKYIDDMNAVSILEISTGWLEGFSLGDREFVCLSSDSQPIIFESFGNREVRILYYWRKDIVIEPGKSSQVFSTSRYSKFLLINGVPKSYNGKKEFMSYFPMDVRINMTQYLKDKGIRFKKATAMQLSTMLSDLEI